MGLNDKFTVQESSFSSEGLRCAGTLLVPAGVERAPVIILGHGFAAERCFRLPAFAERFAEAGFAAFYFDYRTFGDSEGEPRHWVDPSRHQQDWRHAIAHVRNLPQIDPERVVLWGSSFSGGHVLQIASEHPPVAAVIAQVPHVSAIATMRQLPLKTLLRSMAAGITDAVGSTVFGTAHYTPVVGRPGDFAAMTSAECWDGWFSMMPPESTWENKVLSRVFLKLALFSPIRRVHRIRVPTLVIAGNSDSITPPASARETASRIPQGEFHCLDSNHFDVYKGAVFERNIALQLEFLTRVV